MPSARVEPPMSTVSPPQTMKSTPTRSTCDSGERSGGAWGPFTSAAPAEGAGQAQMATRSSTRTGAACGDDTRKRKRAPSRTPAGTDTRMGWRTKESPLPQHVEARLGPDLTTPAATPARTTNRQFERDDGATARLAIREAQFAHDRTRRLALGIAEEGVAYAIDQAANRREVDRDLVLEAVVRRLTRARRVAHREDRVVTKRVAAHAQNPSTIGVGPTLVKAAHGCYRRPRRDQTWLITHENARCAVVRCSSSRL